MLGWGSLNEGSGESLQIVPISVAASAVRGTYGALLKKRKEESL